MDLKAAMAHTRKRMDPLFGHVCIYEHCLPFDVAAPMTRRAASTNPRIWTARARPGDVGALQGARLSGPAHDGRTAIARAPTRRPAAPSHHPVVVVGAGPVGLSLAIDLARAA